MTSVDSLPSLSYDLYRLVGKPLTLGEKVVEWAISCVDPFPKKKCYVIPGENSRRISAIYHETLINTVRTNLNAKDTKVERFIELKKYLNDSSIKSYKRIEADFLTHRISKLLLTPLLAFFRLFYFKKIELLEKSDEILPYCTKFMQRPEFQSNSVVFLLGFLLYQTLAGRENPLFEETALRSLPEKTAMNFRAYLSTFADLLPAAEKESYQRIQEAKKLLSQVDDFSDRYMFGTAGETQMDIVLEAVSKLKKDETYFFPFSLDSQSKSGHALALTFKKEKNDTFTLTIYNAGGGSESNHYFFLDQKGKMRIEPLVITQIAPADLGKTFKESLNKLLQSSHADIGDALKELYKTFKTLGTQSNEYRRTYQGQKLGNCIFKSTSLFLKDFLGPLLYQRLKVYMIAQEIEALRAYLDYDPTLQEFPLDSIWHSFLKKFEMDKSIKLPIKFVVIPREKIVSNMLIFEEELEVCKAKLANIEKHPENYLGTPKTTLSVENFDKEYLEPAQKHLKNIVTTKGAGLSPLQIISHTTIFKRLLDNYNNAVKQGSKEISFRVDVFNQIKGD